MTQVELWSQIAIIALNYIIVSTISASNQKQTVTDLKTDLRTTKEDLMAEVKDTREELLRESEISTKAIIDIVKAEIEKNNESQKGTKNDNQGNQN